jgi:DNA-binding transcriptional ArsR family regulator
MDSSRLEGVVKHDGRLDVLCCLLDEGALSPTEIAVRIGETMQAVRYWVGLLRSFDLVERRGKLVDGEPQYVASLDEQPEWVRAAVRQHRPRAL